MAIEIVKDPKTAGAEQGASRAAQQQRPEPHWERRSERLLHKPEAARAQALAEANQRMEEGLGIATHESRRRLQFSSQPLLDRSAHDDERASQDIADLADGPTLIRALRLERELRKRNSTCLGIVHGGGE